MPKLKDSFDRKLLGRMADGFLGCLPDFDAERFLALAGDGLEDLELMERVRQTARAMDACLPGPTARGLGILVDCLGPALPEREGAEPEKTGAAGDFWRLWPFGEFIGLRGLDDWPASWHAMVELTQRFSAEFAVRPFLIADLDRSLELLGNLLDHPSHHVRRWVSEGTRTRLPWAKAVPGLRQAVLRRVAFLDALKSDESSYVRRSVANHLQDILKDDPEVGLQVLERWASVQDQTVRWVSRHAARGLLKSGHPRVLALFGCDASVESLQFAVSPDRLEGGGKVQLEALVFSPDPGAATVRLDYRLEGPTPSGRRFSKVFRWTDLSLEGEGQARVTRSFSLVPRSTRPLPPGRYLFTLLAAGSLAHRKFSCHEGPGARDFSMSKTSIPCSRSFLRSPVSRKPIRDQKAVTSFDRATARRSLSTSGQITRRWLSAVV